MGINNSKTDDVMGGAMIPSPIALREIYRLETIAMFPALIKISYTVDSVPGQMRIVNNTEDMVFQGETFSAASFKYTAPKHTEKKVGNGTLSISCANQKVIEIIRSIPVGYRAQAEVVAAFYYDEGTAVFEGLEEWKFSLTKVTWDEIVATWQMEYDNRMSLLVPCDKMTAQKCPGIA